jgi:hypothetical protein
MASIVEEVVAINSYDRETKRCVRKLTPYEIEIRKWKQIYHSALNVIRLRPYQKDPDFHNGHWDMIMTWLSEETDYKHSKYYMLNYDDFIFNCDDNQYCIQFTRNGKTSTEFYVLHTEAEMDARADENLLDTILYLIPDAILYNLQEGIKKQITIQTNTKPDNAPSYDSPNCPICFCDFVSVEEEGDHIYNKATGKIPKDDDRVVRVNTCCGHLLCIDCFNNVRNRGNKKCPTCRAELDCWAEDSDVEYEEEEYTLEDIEELTYAENDKELIRITDMVALRNWICGQDGYEGLCSYERVNDYEGFYICQL